MELYQKYADKLKKIAKQSVRKHNTEKALCAISAYAQLSYMWNQFYTDEEVEDMCCELSENIFKNSTSSYNTYRKSENVVLFYDGFGLDTRGLALIYARALVQMKYKLIWVTNRRSQGKVPEIEKVLGQGDTVLQFINMDLVKNHVDELHAVFETYRPAKAFFYTMPNDACAAVVFHHYENMAERYQINLTDHAYWLGTCAFDRCLEFREYGAGITEKFRNVSKDKIRFLPYYPYIDRSRTFQGFPFELKNRKVLFSGGALYKTIGGGNQFYIIVEEILKHNPDTIFLYAGSGDDSEICKLKEYYEDRVYHISERKDLYALLENVDVYLNTYPMVGGLMTQYAAMAGKVPLMLNDTGKTDSSGILLYQEEAGIEFPSVNDVIAEADKLLQDGAYRKQRGEEISKYVINRRKISKYARRNYE